MPLEPQAPYISSSEAAKRFNLTNDHIGLLCRRGKVEGKLLGRLWYVNENSLAAYIQRNIEIQAARREALSKQWRTAWTAGFLILSIFAYSGQYAEAQSIPAPRTKAVEPISLNLSLAAQRFEILKDAMPVPHIEPLARTSKPKEKQNKKVIVRYEPSFAALVGDGFVGVVETVGDLLNQPRVPSVHIVYAKDYEENADVESISNALTAAAIVAGSYIKNLPAPELIPVSPADQNILLSNKNIFAGVELVNEALGDFNSRMFATYKKAGTDFAGAAVFDAQAVAYVWDKTFAVFGERFVHDVYALGSIQKEFYLQSASVLQGTYNTAADEIAKDSTLDLSISVASVAYTPSLTAAVGDSILAKWWGSAVDFVANLFVASSDIVAEKFALQDVDTPTQVPSQKSSDLLPASKPAAGQTFVQKPSSTAVEPKQSPIAEPAPSLQVAPKATFASNNYITQESLNNQFASWMLVVRALLSNNPATESNNTFLGLPSGNTIINNYALSQRIDRLDGVTITNSSINGVSDFSSQGGGGASALTDLSDTLVASPVYGNLLMYNGTKWVNTATSSLGLAGAGNGSIGAGSTGQIAYFSSTNTAVGTSTIFISTAGYVGIGTTTPSHLLYVYGDSAAALARLDSNTTDASLQFTRSGSTQQTWSIGRRNATANFVFAYGANTTGGLSAGEVIVLTNTGNMGLGTTSPYTKLSVGGDIVGTNIMATGTLSALGLITQGVGTVDVAGVNNFFDSIVVDNTSPLVRLRDGSTDLTIAYDALTLNISTESTANAFTITDAGRVGIGTTTPATALDVNGSGQFEGASASLAINPYGGVADTNYLSFAAGRMYVGYTGSAAIIQSSSAKDIRFVTNDTSFGIDNAALVIGGGGSAALGNIGVGTTSPWGKLSINNSTADTARQPLFVVASSTAIATTTHFIIANTGNVGIGTSTSDNLLTVSNSNNGALIYNGSVLTVSGFGSGSTAGGITFTPNAAVGSPVLNIIGFNSAGTAVINTTSGSLRTLQINNAAAGGLQTVFAGGGGGKNLVGIGTTSPFSPLSIHANNGDTNLNLFTVASSTQSATTTLFTIANTGNVGIGTSTPATPLAIAATGLALQLGDFSTAGTHIAFSGSRAFVGYSGSGVSSSNLVLQGGGGKGIFFNVNSSSFGSGNAAVITSAGNFGVGTTSPWAKFSINNSTNDTAGQPLFAVASSTASATTTAFIVTSAGNVGIGTSLPSALLDIVNPNTTEAFRVSRSSSAYFSIYPDQGTYGETDFGSRGSKIMGIQAISAGGGVVIGNSYTGGNTQAPANGLIVAGNVGIGTTSPYAKLSINNSTNDTAGQALFVVASSTASATTTAFIITNAGNVGIGTSAPASNSDLTVAGGGRVQIFGTTVFRPVIDLATSTQSVGLQVLRDTSLTDFWAVKTIQTGQNLGLFVDNTPTSGIYIKSGGNVGIGTTSPNVSAFAAGNPVLTIHGTVSEGRGVLELAGNGIATGENDFGRVAFTNYGTRVARVNAGRDGANDAAFLAFATRPTGGSETERLRITSTGNVGIGTTSPWRTLSVSGTVGFSGLSTESGSDNALCIDPTTGEVTDGGASCAASSLRYKQNIQDLSYGLDKVLEMRPVSFQWNEASGRADHTSLNVGFIAEEMFTLVPEVVEVNASGTPEGIDYDKLTAVLAHAIQEIAKISGSFKDALIAWLADSANGITKLFAKEVQTDKLCVGNTCVTEAQFMAMVAASNQQVQSPAAPEVVVPEPEASSTPEVEEGDTAPSTPEDPPADEAPVVVVPPIEDPAPVENASE